MSIIPPTMPHEQQDKSIEQHQHAIASTLRPFFESQSPLLLKNLLGRCDAIYFWPSLEYWRVAVGEDTPVDVEIGKGYNRGNRVTMMFGEYLNYLALNMELEKKQNEQNIRQDEIEAVDLQHVDQEVAYLAQNDLFHQVKNDIPIPLFCKDKEYNVGGEGKLYQTMIWMGPRHTVSPLHFDPLDNILMQVVGWKRILLFPPDSQTEPVDKGEGESWHYAGTNGNQYNTSAVDIENPNHDSFPNYAARAPVPFECILGPGDGLFIPKRWWHHVRSFDLINVSANVWWR